MPVKKRPTKKPNPRKQLARAIADSSAKAHLTLAWRNNPPAYTVQLVTIDRSVAARFLDLARDVANQLATQRVHVTYDTEWPLGAHEYFALVDDEIPGGISFTTWRTSSTWSGFTSVP